MRLVDGILLSLSVVAATPAFEECLANNCQFVFDDDGSMKPQENTACEAHSCDMECARATGYQISRASARCARYVELDTNCDLDCIDYSVCSSCEAQFALMPMAELGAACVDTTSPECCAAVAPFETNPCVIEFMETPLFATYIDAVIQGCDLVLPPPCPAQYKISTLVPAESDGDERTDPPDGSRLGREGLDVGPKMQEGAKKKKFPVVTVVIIVGIVLLLGVLLACVFGRKKKSHAQAAPAEEEAPPQEALTTGGDTAEAQDVEIHVGGD